MAKSNRPLRTVQTPTHSLALFDDGASYFIESWRFSDDKREVIDRTEYSDALDRAAVRVLMLGTLHSLAYMAKRGQVDLDAVARGMEA